MRPEGKERPPSGKVSRYIYIYIYMCVCVFQAVDPLLPPPPPLWGVGVGVGGVGWLVVGFVWGWCRVGLGLV